MCGIVGIAGCLGSLDETTMKRMFMLNFFRGPDSTGLASIFSNGDVNIVKDSTDPVPLFYNKKFQEALDGAKSRVFLGHNRFATRGGVNRANAHPFEFEHIIGAHNGTLDVDSWNRLEEAIDMKFSVDSQALIAAIAKLGIKKTIALCTTGKDSNTGAWSIVWYDTIEGTINFLRNEHRPMWLAYEKNFKRVFWASTWPTIKAAISHDETEVHTLYTEEGTGFRYFPTDVDTHYKFDVGLFMMGSDTFIKPKLQKIKGREPKPVASSSSGSFPTKGQQNTFGFGVTPSGIVTRELMETAKTKAKTSHGITRRSPDNVIHLFGTDKFPFAGVISREEFDRMLDSSNGCCYWCDRPVAFGEPGLVIYERDNMVLCGRPTCGGHAHVTDDTPSRIYLRSTEFERLR